MGSSLNAKMKVYPIGSSRRESTTLPHAGKASASKNGTQ
jgi:hypothetical protein